jgi:hypothetical protein
MIYLNIIYSLNLFFSIYSLELFESLFFRKQSITILFLKMLELIFPLYILLNKLLATDIKLNHEDIS